MDSAGSSAQLPSRDSGFSLLLTMWLQGASLAEAEHYYRKRGFLKAASFSCQRWASAAALCSRRIHATPLRWQVWVRWSLCSESRNLFCAPCKIAAPLACLLANGFSPLPSGAGTAESKLWGCCIMHTDYLFAFPTRLRKLINFRWTKADSKPAEICNKSLKWKYNSTYNSGKMPFDICRWARIPLRVHWCWTTVQIQKQIH